MCDMAPGRRDQRAFAIRLISSAVSGGLSASAFAAAVMSALVIASSRARWSAVSPGKLSGSSLVRDIANYARDRASRSSHFGAVCRASLDKECRTISVT